jgi:pyroglutamyl-peptidase
VPEAPGSRRRARPDIGVPPQLIVRQDTLSHGRGGNSEVVLVTGFEAFGGEKSNPSWDICERLPREIAGMRVETCRVPCEFRRSIEVVAAAIERHRPLLVICVGQAGGRAKLGVERIAINVDDARMPDNAGARPLDEPIAANGPPAYFATLPVKAMAVAMRAAGVPAEVSNSAGTYVCNHLMYGVLHYLAASGQRARAGFIHVPYSEEQVLDKRDTPGMALTSMVKGVEAAIAAAHEHRHDIKVSEGALD